MKPLENVWNGLLQRRLLPVAILLIAALAAIPFLLSKDPEPIPPSPVAPAAAAGAKDSIAKPVVSLIDDSAPAQRRRVLGAKKNPFAPAPAPKSAAADAQSAAAGTTGATTGAATTGTTGASSGGSVAGSGATSPATTAPGATSTPSEPVATATPAPVSSDDKPSTDARTYSVYSAVVRFGNPDEGEPEQKTLTRLTPLPDDESPAVVYLGVGAGDDGGKAAYFLIGDTVELADDTDCRPSPRDCQGIILSVGKKAELRSVDEATGEVTGRYVLELVKIKRKVVSDSEAAKQARAKVSKSGRRVLRAHQASYGPLRYRYDAKSGLVRKIDKRAYKALLAKSARVALATAGGF